MVTRGRAATINDNQMDTAVPTFCRNRQFKCQHPLLCADRLLSKAATEVKTNSDVRSNLWETAIHTDGDKPLKSLRWNAIKWQKKNCGQSRGNLLQLKGLIISYTAELYPAKCQISSEEGNHFWGKERTISNVSMLKWKVFLMREMTSE